MERNPELDIVGSVISGSHLNKHIVPVLRNELAGLVGEVATPSSSLQSTVAGS